MECQRKLSRQFQKITDKEIINARNRTYQRERQKDPLYRAKINSQRRFRRNQAKLLPILEALHKSVPASRVLDPESALELFG